MDKIKVLSIITGLNTGGAEMMLYKTVKNIDRSKYEPIIVSLLPKGEVAKYIEQEDIPVYSLNLKSSKALFAAVKNFRRIIRKYNPTIVHAYMFHADMFARVVGKLTEVPIIISSVRNENIGSKSRELIMRLTDGLSDYVTVVCKSAAEQLIKTNVIKREKTKVIYNGIELEEFMPMDIPQKIDTFKILSVGRLHKQKNHQLLIQSIAKLVSTYPNLTLSIAGEGGDRAELETLIQEKKLEKNVFLLGRRSDINELLNQADLLVLSSAWEGMPNVVLEAMAVAKPVVATKVGGTPEIVKDHVTGFLVKSNDEQEMVTAIKKMITMSRQERRQMGRQGRERIESMFDIKKTVRETEELYSFLLEEASASKRK